MNAPEHITTAPSDLQRLVNVGPAIARRLERVGITRTSQLAGRDPLAIYELMCAQVGQREDPCVLDTLMSAIEQADGGPARPWWEYSERRRRLLSSSRVGVT
jgi:pathogenicity locus Cdd1 protein